MRIASLGSLNNLAQGVQRQFSTAERTAQESREGLRVSLSELGKGMSTSLRSIKISTIATCLRRSGICSR